MDRELLVISTQYLISNSLCSSVDDYTLKQPHFFFMCLSVNHDKIWKNIWEVSRRKKFEKHINILGNLVKTLFSNSQ